MARGATPSRLAALLTGAVHRAQITAPDFPAWRIEGPLDDPEFYQPLVEATGHPTLTIKWATALEITHFSLTDAMQVLRLRFSEWIQSRGFDTTSVVCPPGTSFGSPREFWRMFARRPGMFLGDFSGSILQAYLIGMKRGGDWLDLPSLQGLNDIVDKIASCSRDSYGSDFAAYRIYESNAAPLLTWIGLDPSCEDWPGPEEVDGR